jgi:nitroreductase
MNMFDAIFSRRTIHHFLQEKLEWDVIDGILNFANSLPMLTKGISVEFKLVSNIEKKQGFHGPFTIKAPYYICISSEEKEDYLINAGYLMQQLNLYITSKGLGTCFVEALSPGYSLKSSMKYKYVTALAFGKTAETLYRNSLEAKRLPEKDTVIYKEEVTPDIRQILTAARLAPSLYNSQPWRFVVYKNRIHIFTKKNYILSPLLDFNKMIDMGVMMANFLLAAEELWVDVSLSKSSSIQSRQFHNNEYVCTVTIG